MKKLIFFISISFSGNISIAQNISDTPKTKLLQEVILKGWIHRDISALPDEQNGFLTSGKKSEVIAIGGTNTNVALKTGRQLFAKMPGVFVYDMDGSGNQLNISTRGLDPHRSWEFNVRQNDVIINSDIYGYPASHYSPPAESYEKIELVRGTASLQYGAQFGGMINYVTKKPDTLKMLSFESINTIGSFNLLSSYNAVGGRIKKFSYYAYYNKRHSNGYRQNSESDAEAEFVQMHYQFSSKILLKAEFGRSKYLYHIPGPLNDSMFYTDPKTSTRSRNYFSPDICVPSLNLNWKISNNTKINFTVSGVFGNRSSVQLDTFANIPDTIDAITNAYKNRQVDIDHFNSRTAEFCLFQNYKIGVAQCRLASGFVYMNNDLHRQQLGIGTAESNYDLTLVQPGFGRDIHFKTNNIAFFAANDFLLSKRFTISPGLRFENGISKMSGNISYYDAQTVPNNIHHNFILSGISAQYLFNKENNLYGGISQAYRPVIFKDIIPASTYERIDKNLKDAFGYNAEVGVRGKLFNYLQYDITIFSLEYNNRMGALILQDSVGQPYTYKTNIGNSRTNGIEFFLQYKFPLSSKIYAGLFSSTSYMDAKYVSGQVSNGSKNISIAGKKVEAAPEWISRNGLEILCSTFSCTILYSYTSSSFSDALNTAIVQPSGAKGPVPGYSILDINATLKASSIFTLRAGISNIFNKQYFTKRPVFYPGPGIWPSDGRNGYISIGVRI